MSTPILRTLALGAALLALAGCRESTGAHPGSYIGQLVSPEPAEGAALVQLVGPGIRSVTGDPGTVFSAARGDTVRVAVVREPAGTLRFRVFMDGASPAPQATVLQVAGPDDVLRATAGYSVTLTPESGR